MYDKMSLQTLIYPNYLFFLINDNIVLENSWMCAADYWKGTFQAMEHAINHSYNSSIIYCITMFIVSNHYTFTSYLDILRQSRLKTHTFSLHIFPTFCAWTQQQSLVNFLHLEILTKLQLSRNNISIYKEVETLEPR